MKCYHQPHPEHTAEESAAHSVEVDILYSQLKALEAEVQQLSVKEKPAVLHIDPGYWQVASLQLQNQLREQAANQETTIMSGGNSLSFKQKQPFKSKKSTKTSERQDVFCYQCGEDGRITKNLVLKTPPKSLAWSCGARLAIDIDIDIPGDGDQ